MLINLPQTIHFSFVTSHRDKAKDIKIISSEKLTLLMLQIPKFIIKILFQLETK